MSLCSVTLAHSMEAPRKTTPDPEKWDLHYLKKFYNSAYRWGLYGKIKRMKRADFEKLVMLHEKYDLKTEYLTYTKQLIKKKPKLKERKQLNRHSYWDTELRSFLIKNKVIEYMPTKGTRLDPSGFRFQF